MLASRVQECASTIHWCHEIPFITDVAKSFAGLHFGHGDWLLFGPEQFRGNSLVECVFQQLVYLQSQVLLFVFLKQVLGVGVGQWIDVDTTVVAEPNSIRIAQQEAPVLRMFGNRPIQQERKLPDHKVSGCEAGSVNVKDVINERLLTHLCEPDDDNQ
jgi:hypothetical protein